MNRSKRGGSQGNGGEKAKRYKTDDESGALSLSEDCPVLVQRINYDDDTPPTISLTPDLGVLLHPLSSDQFLERCLRKKAVHITCEKGAEDKHADARVSGLCKEMCGLDAESILRETSSDNIFLWLRGKADGQKDGSENADLIRSIEIADVDTAIALHKLAGHATYCRAPSKVEQSLVSSLLRATGLGCGQYDPSGESSISMGRGEVETFLSTDGHLTNWHYDFQENFTIQLSGIKRWTLQQGTIQDPVRGCTPHYAAPEAVESQLKAAHLIDQKFRFGYPETGVTARGDVMSIDVKPGDTFYFPAGMWHKVETIEPGVSINVSLMASNYATVTCQALQHFLLKEKGWREPVLNSSTTSAIDHLKSLLKDLPSLIKDLERSGCGAEAIIPPILQYPPRFSLAEDDDWENAEEGGGGSGENHMDAEEDGEAVGNDDESDNDADVEDEQDGVDDDSEGVIDPHEFDNYPSDWKLEVFEPGNFMLQPNPLSTLHRMDEITAFYKKGNQSREENIFVLNVNYAGNEMHQSAVRVVFRDSKANFVQMLLDSVRMAGGNEMVLPITDAEIPHMKFLVYHGYIQIIH
jgi:hypothetical protein